MGGRAKRGVVVLLAAVFLSSVSFAGDPAPEPAEDAGEADPLGAAAQDTWPMQDGCPARTRATRTRPLLGALATAWAFEAPGRIVGDPRVWREWVVVESVLEHGRALDVLRLSDGKPVIPRRKLEKAGDLDPVLWNDLVLLHETGLPASVFRVSPQNQVLEAVPGYDARGAQFFVDGDLLCLETGLTSELFGRESFDVPTLTVVRRRVARAEPVWSKEVSGALLGQLAARHGRVYALLYVPRAGYVTPQARVVSFDLESGSGAEVDLGWFATKLPKGGGLSVGAQELFAVLPGGVLLKEDRRANAARVGLVGGRFGEPYLLDGVAAAVAWGSKTYAAIHEKATVDFVESPFLSTAPGTDPTAWRWRPLVRGADDPDLLPGARPPVVARGIGFFASATLDLPRHRVLEVHPPLTDVVIPARETMLSVENDARRLVARRAARPDLAHAPGPRLPDDPADPRLEVVGATAVSYDGAVRTGKATWSPKDGKLFGFGKDALSPADLGLLVDRDGHVLHGPDAGFTARALPWAVAQKLRGDWAALAKKASYSQDLPTLRRLSADLVARGARIEEIFPLEKEASRLETPSPIPRPPVKERVAEVAARRRELVAAETAGLWTAFSTLPDTVLYAYRLDLLRGLLEASPDDPQAVAWVRAELPEGLVPPGSMPALEWLEVLEAAWKTKLSLVAAKTRPPMTDDERVLAAARLSWRSDLVGIRSDRLLLITPVSKPGRIARCLSLGEVVCSALDGLFGLEGSAAASADPLVIHLYESQKEYLAQSPAAHESGESAVMMEYTLGHYSPSEGVSRLFVPEGREAFESVMDTLAHELTHHWVDRRMPPPAGQVRRGGGGGPGYFLEEGFATLVEEFLFDLRARAWTTHDRHARSLDAIAHAKKLLDWDLVFSVDYRGFGRLAHEPSTSVSLRWSLGAMRWSETNFFYAQAAATCHWLMEAEGGKYRPLLVRWIQDFHGRGVEPDSVARRLEISPAQLGARVTAWAKEASAE